MFNLMFNLMSKPRLDIAHFSGANTCLQRAEISYDIAETKRQTARKTDKKLQECIMYYDFCLQNLAGIVFTPGTPLTDEYISGVYAIAREIYNTRDTLARYYRLKNPGNDKFEHSLDDPIYISKPRWNVWKHIISR